MSSVVSSIFNFHLLTSVVWISYLMLLKLLRILFKMAKKSFHRRCNFHASRRCTLESFAKFSKLVSFRAETTEIRKSCLTSQRNPCLWCLLNSITLAELSSNVFARCSTFQRSSRSIITKRALGNFAGSSRSFSFRYSRRSCFSFSNSAVSECAVDEVENISILGVAAFSIGRLREAERGLRVAETFFYL